MNSNTSKTSCKRGFTLIELLVVVLIIGILAAVAVPQYQKAVEKAYVTQAITQLRALAEAEKVYFLDNGQYTREWDKLDIDISKTKEHPIATEKHQKNWYFALTNATTEYPIVWARREGRDFQKGAYYIVYDMKTDKVYCEAYAVDTESVRFCSAFGAMNSCPHGEGDSYGDYKCALIP